VDFCNVSSARGKLAQGTHAVKHTYDSCLPDAVYVQTTIILDTYCELKLACCRYQQMEEHRHNLLQKTRLLEPCTGRISESIQQYLVLLRANMITEGNTRSISEQNPLIHFPHSILIPHAGCYTETRKFNVQRGTMVLPHTHLHAMCASFNTPHQLHSAKTRPTIPSTVLANSRMILDHLTSYLSAGKGESFTVVGLDSSNQLAATSSENPPS
jgi:hypothetical protein